MLLTELFLNMMSECSIVLYCIVSIHLYSATCSAHQSEALPVRETHREESSVPLKNRMQFYPKFWFLKFDLDFFLKTLDLS